VRAKDADAVLALMAPDFTQVKGNGATLNRTQVARQMRATWPDIQSIDAWTMDLSDFTLKGREAQARVKDQMTAGIRDGRGQVRIVKINDISETTWVYTPKGWRYKRIEDVGKGPAAEMADAGNVQYVSGKAWARESYEGRQALRRKQREKELASMKEAPKAPPGMTPAKTRAMLTDLYAQYRTAIRRKDAEAALSLFTDDYAVQVGGQRLTRAQVRQGLDEEAARVRSVNAWTMDLEDIAYLNGHLVVVLKERRTVTLDDGGRTRRVTTNTTMRDTWVKTGDGWKTQLTEVIGS